MKLTEQEYKVLNKIAKKSGMDCWFFIERDSEGSDYINDLEQDIHLTLREGIKMLFQGMTSFIDYDLSIIEQETFLNLIDNLNININVAPIEGVPEELAWLLTGVAKGDLNANDYGKTVSINCPNLGEHIFIVDDDKLQKDYKKKGVK